jgi:hypothetical protein
MKLATHPAPVALGITTLYVLPMLVPIFSTSHSMVYHLHGKLSAILLPLLLFAGLVWLTFFLLLMLARRPGLPRHVIWTVLLIMLPWIALRTAWSLTQIPLPHRVSLAALLAGSLTLLILMLLSRMSLRGTTQAEASSPRQSIFARLQTFTATILGFLSLTGLLLIGQISWFSFQARAMNDPQPMHHPAAIAQTHGSARPAHPRILWILFDELSYRQVYEHRFPGLNLPAFDRLAAQSTVFTHTIPAGLMTEAIIPSLMSGVPSTALRATTDGQDIFLFDPVRNRWKEFDSQHTVFHDAIDRGYSTGIVGWYNPYCRILAEVLDSCTWSNHYGGPFGISDSESLSTNLTMPFRSLWDSGRHYFSKKKPSPRTTRIAAQTHTADYRALFTAADAALNDFAGDDFAKHDPSIDLLFLHMPIPHPGGIYNRHTGQFTTGPSTYLDNLALTDAYLAHLRSLLEKRGAWDSTTILVMGDHSWRTAAGPKWAAEPEWTPEEQAASDGGKFDNRPAYLLKLPNQQTSAHIEAPFEALRTRTLLDALMDHAIDSPEALASWANARP